MLIDEAVTPLIISAATEGRAVAGSLAESFATAAKLSGELQSGTHFRVDHARREIRLTDAGRLAIERQCAPLGGVWSGARRREELIVQALTARELYRAGKDYVVRDGAIVIVDEFTGRLMPDRTWRDGMHQAVEAKEGVEIRPLQETLARISFQRFFRLYGQLSGMTGTARESRSELWRTYRLPVVAIPTHRPSRRTVASDAVFAVEDEKWSALISEIERLHGLGRPVLIGTRSVRASEHVSELLSERGIAHDVLNAVRHAEEARIIAGAGASRAVTVATNMAGRGADIPLGRGVAEMGGLAVIASERHESRRVDRQLFGRGARQGEPGSAGCFVSLEDEIVRRYASRLVRLVRRLTPGGAGLGLLGGLLIRRAQAKAQKLAAQRRRAVLRQDDWLDDALGFAGDRH